MPALWPVHTGWADAERARRTIQEAQLLLGDRATRIAEMDVEMTTEAE